MKKILTAGFLCFFIFSCGVNKQTQQIKALEKCQYRITAIQDIYVAGTDVKKLLSQQNINIGNLPGLALGMLRKDIPLRAQLNLEISNPSSKPAGINQFDYKILVNDQELANGLVDRQVNLPPGQTQIVPVQLNSNIYGLLSNPDILNNVMRALQKNKDTTQKPGILTIKIRPTIMLGNTPFKYPGYITINKEISSNILI